MEVGEAAMRCNAMWERLGKQFERHAYLRAKSASACDIDPALGFAKAAEGCFWHATGEQDCFDLETEK